MRFARETSEGGAIHTLRVDPQFNYLPLPAYLGAACWRIAQWLDVGFPKIFKIPMILADGISIYLVFRIVRDRVGQRSAWVAAALLSWNAAGIYIAGYHGNTDPIYGMLALLATDLLRRQKFLLAGTALGVAINIKLIPTLLILPMLLQCRNGPSTSRFVFGLALMALPNLPMVLAEPQRFVNQILKYGSLIEHWGINYILLELMHIPTLSAYLDRIVAMYSVNGRIILFLAMLLLGLVARRRDDLDALRVMTAATMLFLILTPGYSPQYLTFALPLMAVTLPRWGFIFGAVAGAYLGVNWWIEHNDGWLVRGMEIQAPRRLAAMIGFVAWAVLVAAMIHLFRRQTKRHDSRAPVD